MLTFISCAKTMTSRSSVAVPEVTIPTFEADAVQNALEMSQYSASELEKLLRVNAKIAAENRLRYHDFCSEDNRVMPAICAYTGAVYKRILPKDFTTDDFYYAQDHLRITSFLYGLLRPLDGIKPYRLEGDVLLPEKGGISMFDYWKPILTDYFIAEIKRQGGVLVNLASGEMQNLFDWKRVEREVRVITPEFQVWKGGELKTIVIYTKMNRGEMVRFIIKNRIENPEDLESFTWEGFELDEARSTDNHLLFTLV
ncbi:peroxide stress protein YaaA [uncultured Bacteroides sp.]|uniref:peroxide stress protein YaaA n=1 Tax=uncultured Bacteroides sp. TaxID=162156 RepID=UPI0025DA88D1|nr:peroxide stress protein YaaA [uncultured Bacteroides sp.]